MARPRRDEVRIGRGLPSDTHTCCRTFGSGAVTTCFYELGLSRMGFSEIYRFHRDNLTLMHMQHLPFQDEIKIFVNNV